MSGPNTQHDFGILLGLAYQSFVRQLHVELRRHGFKKIAPTVGYVLRAVADAPMNQRQLSKVLGITDQGTAKLVNEMARLRLLERRPDPADGRARMLAVGPQGKALLGAARRFHARFEQQLARKLGTSVATTRTVLEAIAAAAPAQEDRYRLRPM